MARRELGAHLVAARDLTCLDGGEPFLRELVLLRGRCSPIGAFCHASKIGSSTMARAYHDGRPRRSCRFHPGRLSENIRGALDWDGGSGATVGAPMNPTEPTDDAIDETPEESAGDRDRRLRPEEQDPKLWKADGWTARVIKNEDDDGWAVEMTCDGATEPSLVGPWTMGRDKKNPKPLDTSAFATLVKTANEILARHEAQRRALLHRQVTITAESGARMRFECEVIPDEDDPHAILTVRDEAGETVTRARLSAGFKLTAASARTFLERGGGSEG